MPYELQDHQSRVSDVVGKGGSRLALHSMGSGKTLTAADSIAKALAADKNAKALVIAPASLVTNFYKELDKHGVDVDRNRIEVVSYEKAANNPNALRGSNYDVIVMDEAHRMRNRDTKRFQELAKVLGGAKSRLLMTGTGMYNQVSDLATLVNLSSGEDVFPSDPQKFDNKYIERVKHDPGILMRILGAKEGETTKLKNTSDLQKRLVKYVDYHDAAEGQSHMFPKVEQEVVPVEMSEAQAKMYDAVSGDMPWILRKKIELGMPLSKQESANLNAFATGIRQVSNSTAPYLKDDDETAAVTSSKLLRAVEDLRKAKEGNEDFRGIVYSNYLKAGIDPMKILLEKEGITPSVFTGSLSKNEKKKLVDDYNSGKSPVMILSSSGGEGLDLKGTRLVQILEPHFNKSKIKQVVARSARYGSHLDLPEEHRNVAVKHYVSTKPRSFVSKVLGTKPGKSIDQYLMDNSDSKEALNEQVLQLLRNR